MSARNRLGTVAAMTLAATAGAMLLSACDPNATTGANGPQSAAPSQSGAAPAQSDAAPSGGGQGKPAVNGTSAANRLTISTGTKNVLMNGTSVNFATDVRDLAWSPDGSKAAFVNSNGDLMVVGADGTKGMIVAKNPGGQTWSHPTWQVYGADAQNSHSGKQNIVFAAKQDGVLKLESVPATAANGTPQPLEIGNSEEGSVQPPKTSNQWPNSGGPHGTTAYANATDGQVYIRDDYLRLSGAAIAKGSEPALAPDGQTVVFVRSVKGHDHLFEKAGYGTPEKDLTPNATTDFTEPAISHDGKTVAARTPDGVYTLPIDGSAAPTKVSGYSGLPAYR
ncbi:LpqB family beta-propeller domain-containing protein [Kitasatospora sp. NPDC001175]|uniref:LpqB family beta-propeller domain-containing protein n=1 Tax=Kitasatospora sp. NPDC001175 TaxID=3157103 RepID=UPI003CFF826B